MSFVALPITWTLDTLAMNVGQDAYGHSVVVNVPEWDDPPAPKPIIAERAEGPYAYQGMNYPAGKSLTVQGFAQAETPQSRELLFDRLRTLCWDPATFFPLTCVNPYRGDTLTTYVKRNDQPELRRLPDGVSISVNFSLFASDARKYSVANGTQQTGLSTPGVDGILWNGSPSASGGIEWNGSPSVSGGLIYESSQGSTGTLVLSNSGTEYAPITFSITATAINPKIICLQTQQVLKWGGTVSVPSVLTIDTGTGRVTLTGGGSSIDVAAGLLNADMIQVPPRNVLTGVPGTITLAFSADAGSGGSIMSAVNSNVSV